MQNYFVSCAKGTEHVLVKELEILGAKNIKEGPGGVSCAHPDATFHYLINLKSRIAFRVYKPILEFKASSEAELYKHVKAFDWQSLMEVDQTFAIHANCKSSFMTHSKYLALKVKDGLCDRFRDDTGKRPSVDVKNADISLNVFLNRNVCTISLDSSGYSLHKRGYRFKGQQAPMMETLAAALVHLSGWDFTTPFYDLMCGSGTIAVEAALMARSIFPALKQDAFNFKNWSDFNAKKYTEYVDQISKEQKKESPEIYINDIKKNNVMAAKRHLYKAGITEKIHISNQDILMFKPQTDNGMMIINPPYGVRMGEAAEIKTFYQKLNLHLKEAFKGFTVCIISADESHLREIRMSPKKVYTLYNANLKCKYGIFEVF